MSYKYLGDIIVVQHIGKNVKSDILVLPETIRNDLKPIQATVLAIGKLIHSRKHYLRKRKLRGCDNKTFACDYIKIGDTILVPEELGTRNRISDNPNAIIYDSEDVMALVEIENNLSVSQL